MPEDLRLVTLLRLCETLSSAILLLFAAAVPLSLWTVIFCVEAMAAFYIAVRLPNLRSPWVFPVILAELVLSPIVIRFAEGLIPVAITTYLLLVAQVVAVAGSIVYGRRRGPTCLIIRGDGLVTTNYKLSIVALIAVVSCRGHDTSKTATAAPRAPLADSVAAQAKNLLCRDTTPGHPDPGKLVREYVRRDGGGEFLSSNSFWVSATECAEGGADVARVITSSTIDSLGIRADTARFAVTYHFLGDLLQGPVGFAPNVRTRTDTFVVIHRPYGWRIVGPHGMPIMMRDAARRFWPLTRADLARLDSAARVAPN